MGQRVRACARASVWARVYVRACLCACARGCVGVRERSVTYELRRGRVKQQLAAIRVDQPDLARCLLQELPLYLSVSSRAATARKALPPA